MKNFGMGFVYAWRGLLAGWQGQRNIKVMLAVALAAVAMGWWLEISGGQWAVVLLACGLVFSLELANTALEKLVDILSPGHDPRYGQIKDVMAGAVLVAAVFSAVAGVVIFLPYLLRL